MLDLLYRSSIHIARIVGRRRRFALKLGALCGAALLILAAARWSQSATSSPASQRKLSRARVARIPTAAEGPISAALGHEQASYRVHGLRADNSTQRFGAAFSRDGVRIASGSARVRVRLLSYGRDKAMRVASRVSPRVSANRVEYARPGVDEWYANGPLGLEQGFDVNARPRAARGPLTLALGLSGNVRPRLVRSGLLLETAAGSLRYGGLTASDARGHRLRSWLLPRSGRLLIRVDDRQAAYPLRIDPLVQQAKLTANDGAANDLFAAAAVSSDTIAVGAPGHTFGGVRAQGAVYVFQKPASGWAHLTTHSAVLTVANAPEAVGLGESVAISGDTIVAGAGGRTVGTNPTQGAVYVFVKPTSGWKDATQTAELTASDGNPTDGLGESVAAAGDTVVAGPAQHDVDKNVRQGEAYVFVKPASGWANSTESAILRSTDGAAGDFFGVSVAISGDTIAVGAPQHKVGANVDQGAAYVYTKPSGGWSRGASQNAELTAADGGGGDHFGFGVASSGDTVFAGAPEHQVGINHQGAAYVFVKPFFGWNPNTSQTAELTASDGATGDRFGSTLAASGDSVLAGALLHQVGPNASQGAAYLFTKPGDTWTSTRQTEELTARDGATGDAFGISLGLAGNLAVAGAVPKIGDNVHQGATYLFGVPSAISIASPANGATYPQNSVIAASFSCTAADGATITACTAPTADGAPIDTSTLGQHSFTATASDSDGISATQTSTYAIAAPGAQTQPGPGPLRLAITAVRQSASRWRLGSKLPQIARRLPPVGATFSFVLSQLARATLSFTRESPGRTVRGRCAAQTTRNNRRPRCTRTIAAGALTLNGHGGLNRVRFDGRLAHGKTLRPGRYRMTITATTPPGQRTHSRPLQFTVAK